MTKYIRLDRNSGNLVESEAVIVSEGPLSSSKLVALNEVGKLDKSLIPSEVLQIYIESTAGENILDGDIVYINDNLAYKASRLNSNIHNYPIGISCNSAQTGQGVVVLVSGIKSMDSWNLNPGQPVFLDLDGSMTQTMPNQGSVILLGKCLDSNTVCFNIVNMNIVDHVFYLINEIDGQT